MAATLTGQMEIPDTKEASGRQRFVVGRIGLALAAIGLAALTIVQSTAQIVDGRMPDVAVKIAPWLASAHARKAELALAREDFATADFEAKAALRRDPTRVSAVRTLGQMDPGAKGARLLALALRLSRRDLPTHMSLLERAAMAGDLNTALSHYSQALRTSQRSWPVLLPPLVQAAAEPSLIVPLALELAKQPQWLYPFYREWIKSSTDTRAMAKLSREMDRRGRPLNRDVRVGLLSKLVDANDWASLSDELRRARPACGPDACLDGNFRRYGLLLPVDWAPSAADRALVVRVPTGSQDFALDYSFTGPGDAPIARRLMMMPPGDYVLTHKLGTGAAPTAGVEPGKVALLLQCAGPNGTTLSDPSRAEGATWWTRARVPKTCRAQWLVVQVTSDESSPISGRIERLQLKSAANGTD